jgi:hypothetical protein
MHGGVPTCSKLIHSQKDKPILMPPSANAGGVKSVYNQSLTIL